MIRVMFVHSLAFILMSGIVAPSAVASTSLRCGTHVIHGGGRHGPTMYEVLKKCGDPVERHGRIWIYEINGQYQRLSFDDKGLLLRVDRID